MCCSAEDEDFYEEEFSDEYFDEYEGEECEFEDEYDMEDMEDMEEMDMEEEKVFVGDSVCVCSFEPRKYFWKIKHFFLLENICVL